MPITLGANIGSLKAQRALGQSTDQLSRVFERLSSGQRINRASDDAAGLSIALQLNSSARVFSQAIRNVNDGVSAANIAEGALTSLRDISIRQLELAEQAANGTYSRKQRNALNGEANALVDEFNRIAGSASFNGMSLLDPSLGSVIIQAGYGAGGQINIGLSDDLRRAVGDGTFTAGQTISLPFNAFATLTGDYNGDGKSDVVMEYHGSVQIFLGNGDGTFKAGISAAFQGTDRAVAQADLNGDGKLDLISSSGSVLVGNGDGTFRTGQNIGIGPDSQQITVGDINGDGKLDVVATDWYSGIHVSIGNGDGTFKAETTYGFIGRPRSIASADVNGDGKLDLVIGDVDFLKVYVLLGNGNGTFRSSASFQCPDAPKELVTGDFNGDGAVDFLVEQGSSNLLTVALGNNDGTFSFSTISLPGGGGYSIAAADFNGDGWSDFAVTDGSGAILVGFGNGDGSFKAPISHSAGLTSFVTAVGDFNNDGRFDIALGNGELYIGGGGFTNGEAHLNLNSQQCARDALTTVTATLQRIETQLGDIGAITSRFGSVVSILQTQRENFLAAAGRISDADIGAESSSLVRHQILQQSASAVLAQANLQPQVALSLLRG